MKKSKFQKWYNKIFQNKITRFRHQDDQKESWNAAVKHILKSIQYKNKMFEGNWQHEDVDFLIEDLKDMIEK